MRDVRRPLSENPQVRDGLACPGGGPWRRPTQALPASAGASRGPREGPGDSKGPLAHPPERTYPCCLPALGEFGTMTPHEGSAPSLAERGREPETGRPQGRDGPADDDGPAPCGAGPSGGGGWGIRTPEGVNPTRFPSVRHRPLGESSWLLGRCSGHGQPQKDTGPGAVVVNRRRERRRRRRRSGGSAGRTGAGACRAWDVAVHGLWRGHAGARSRHRPAGGATLRWAA